MEFGRSYGYELWIKAEVTVLPVQGGKLAKITSSFS